MSLTHDIMHVKYDPMRIYINICRHDYLKHLS